MLYGQFIRLTNILIIIVILLIVNNSGTGNDNNILLVTAQTGSISYIYTFGDPQSTYSLNDIIYIIAIFDQPYNESINQCKSNSKLRLNIGDSADYVPRAEFIELFTTDPDEDPEELLSIYSAAFRLIVKPKRSTPTAGLGLGLPLLTGLNFTGCDSNMNIPDIVDLTGQILDTGGVKIIIDTVQPTILSVNTRKPNGKYSINTLIDILVTFNKPIKIDPNPQDSAVIANNPTLKFPVLKLNTGASIPIIGIPFPKDSSTIAFRYIVGLGESTDRLDLLNNNSLILNDCTIYSVNSLIPVSLDLPIKNQLGSLAQSVNISIIYSGYKHPPNSYNPEIAPLTLINSNTNTANPVMISVTMELNSLISVDESSQSFRIDFLLLTEWYDSRFNQPILAPEIINNKTTLITNGIIWSPKLTFSNARENPSSFDSKLITRNNGSIQLIERYIATFNSPINARAFPFDSQILYIQIRSAQFNKNIVDYKLANKDLIAVGNTVLTSIKDSTWELFNYYQSISTINSGLFSNTNLIEIGFTAKRQSTFNALNILFPLLLLCCACLFTYILPLRNGSRLSTPLGCLMATLGFSLVLSNVSPPVSYITRMGLLIFQTYWFSILTFIFQLIVTRITTVTKDFENELKKSNDKLLIKDEEKWKLNVEKLLIPTDTDNNNNKSADIVDLNKPKSVPSTNSDNSSSISVFRLFTVNSNNFKEWDNRLDRINDKLGIGLLSLLILFTAIILGIPM